MISTPPVRPARKIACIALAAALLPGAVLAQGIEQSATGTATESGAQTAPDTNEYGWPTDYVAQGGAGVTNAITTGFSGPESSGSGSGEISLPEDPGPELCSDWEGTDAHAFCMKKLVQQ